MLVCILWFVNSNIFTQEYNHYALHVYILNRYTYTKLSSQFPVQHNLHTPHNTAIVLASLHAPHYTYKSTHTPHTQQYTTYTYSTGQSTHTTHTAIYYTYSISQSTHTTHTQQLHMPVLASFPQTLHGSTWRWLGCCSYRNILYIGMPQ